MLLFATAALWIRPPVIESLGFGGAYGLIVVLALPVAHSVRHLPPTAETAAVAVPGLPQTNRWFAHLVPLSVFVFFAEHNALCAFAERIGSAAGLSGQYIGLALGVATLLSAAGAALVAWLGTRISRGLAVAGATLVQIGAFIWLGREPGASLFLILVVLLSIAWNIVNPFRLGILAQLDTSGSSLALAPAATGLGLAAGPAIGAAVLSPGAYAMLLCVCVALAATSALLLWPPLRALDRLSGNSRAG